LSPRGKGTNIRYILCTNKLSNSLVTSSLSLNVRIAVLLSLALVLGLELSSRTNFESLALALALKVKSLLTTLENCRIKLKSGQIMK